MNRAHFHVLFMKGCCVYSSSMKQMFTIGESRSISHANDTQAQQVAPNPHPGRFSTETPPGWERWLQIQHEQRRRRHQQDTTEQREHRLAQRRQRRQQETEEQRNRRLEYQRHYDHFTLWKTQIYYFAGFPRLYRSKSAKFSGPRYNNFHVNCSATFCALFLFFSKSGGQNNAKYAFQYIFNNNTPQYAKKKKKKRKNNVWTFTTIFAVCHLSSS